ncbi:MAG: flagellar basal body P-ring formation chaperone FlgA [Proteobacteria bacterium]|nr:flagellar basal body P-ring formation chaperone FlgA [Pseudomonadota bacterium]MBU1743171.1 flagellar basal body P-ring formation chaperone FlgA [Pseudomonadota bacterium]
MKRVNLKIILPAILAILVAAGPALALSIQFRPEAKVRGSQVRLQDVALVLDSNEPRVLSLYRLKLGPSPALGQSGELHRRTIVAKLTPLLGQAAISRLRIPAVIYLTRERAALSSRLIEDKFREFVLGHMPWPRDRVRIYGVTYRGEINFSAGRVDITVVPVGHPIYRGEVALNFHIRIDDKLVKVLLVRGRVDVYSEVVVAVKAIAPGNVIGPGDVRVVKVNQANLSPGLATGPRQVIGLQVRTSFRPGQRIHLSQVKSPRLIRRGEEVTIVVETGGLRITAPGRALTDGHVGGRVSVLNLATKRKIMANVKHPGIVTVSF